MPDSPEITEPYMTSNTALLLVDLLNDFLDEKGKLAPRIGTMLERTRLKTNLARLIAGARAKKMKLFYVPHELDEHVFDDVKYVHPRWKWGMENKVFWKESWGSDFYPPFAPKKGDIISTRHRTFDGFFNTNLQQELKKAHIEKVVFAGLTSHTCVEGAGRHALEEGYHVTFLADGVAEFTEDAHRAAITLSYPTFGHQVTTIDSFLRHVKEG